MLRDHLNDLLSTVPFEPFRIKLVNGDTHDVFDPQTLAVQQSTVVIASHDQNWAAFPIDKINSIESLIADFPNELARHTQE
jgi:hypothetical protein